MLREGVWRNYRTEIVLRERPPGLIQSCADCPGFPVLGAGDDPHVLSFSPGASESAPGLAFAFM